MVRVASLLNASLVLTRKGFVQEVYILCRSIDEANDDVLFWALPLGETGTSQEQMTHLKDFYQELMPDPSKPLSNPKRQAVQRARIHELTSNAHGPEVSENVKNIVKGIYRLFSGYVHGAYSTIMELYGRDYHLNGMLGTPRIDECINNLPNYVYRSFLSLEQIAVRLEKKELAARIRSVTLNFANETKCI